MILQCSALTDGNIRVLDIRDMPFECFMGGVDILHEELLPIGNFLCEQASHAEVP